VVVVVVLPVVEADTGVVVVDVKIIASVKIVAAAVARYVLCSRGIFLLLLLLSIFILCASQGKQRIKEFSQLTRKEPSKQSSMIRSNNVMSSHRNIIKSFLVVALKKPLVMLYSLKHYNAKR
jgi:cell division protein FtsW (lipid II flippase)